MQVELIAIGDLAGKSGRHECAATLDGTVLFRDGRAAVEVDAGIFNDMVARQSFPYGVFYKLAGEEGTVANVPQHKKTTSVLTSGGKEEPKAAPSAEKPAPAHAVPLLTFAQATKPGVAGTSVITATALKKAIREARIAGTVNADGNTVYRLDDLRGLTKSTAN